MSRNAQKNYSQYVHEFTDDNGKTRYAVGEWQEAQGQYWRPLSKQSQQLTGCTSEFTKRLQYWGGYLTRAQALRRARYLFGAQRED